MKLVILFGPPAVGKLTVAKKLSMLTSYPVLQNHATIDLVEPFFKFRSEPFLKTIHAIRFFILKEALKQKLPGIILTTGYTNTKRGAANFLRLQNLMRRNKGQIYFVQLICNKKLLSIRVKSKERKLFGKINTVKDLKKMLTQWDFFSPPSHVKNISIDTSELTAIDSAKKILNYINS